MLEGGQALLRVDCPSPSSTLKDWDRERVRRWEWEGTLADELALEPCAAWSSGSTAAAVTTGGCLKGVLSG